MDSSELSEIIDLSELKPEDIPLELRCETYFDLNAHRFDHAELIKGSKSVIDVLEKLHSYTRAWLSHKIKQGQRPITRIDGIDELRRYLKKQPLRSIGKYQVLLEPNAIFFPANIYGYEDEGEIHTVYVARGAKIFGANFYTDTGDIFIGEKTEIEPGVTIHGPAIIGQRNKLRGGAYIREDTIVGNDCILRGELKGSVVMNSCDYPHPSYLGDSICGYRTHFGNQVTAANYGLLNIVEPQEVHVRIKNKIYNTGRQKVGIVMGDFSQVGCNTSADPGVFLMPWTLVYPLTRLRVGVYGPNVIIKYKPEKKGVIEITPLRR